MEITQLEFFVKVVEEKSFSKAAEKVFRTQPAVSIAVKRLEAEVGTPLFDRVQKSATLTEAGKIVFDCAKRIIALRDQALKTVAELRSLERGRVRIGANESTSMYLLPDVILAYRTSHPKVRVEIFRHVSDRLPRQLLDRNLDFALMASKPADRDLEAFPILNDELILITSPKHPFSNRRSVTVKELGKESFLAHNVQTASRLKVIEMFEKHRTPLNITLELATVETIKRFVQKRIGIAFVPRMCVAEELERGTLCSITVRGLTYNRTLWVAHCRGIKFSPAAKAFLDLLRQRSKLYSE